MVIRVLDYWTADREVPVQCSVTAVVSLSKEIYSHCSSPQNSVCAGCLSIRE